MGSRRAAVGVALATALLTACASSPVSQLRNDIWQIYWASARACIGLRYAFYVDNVKPDGSVLLIGHTSAGIEDYRACYWKGLESSFEKRRAAGLPVPEGTSAHPPVEIDLD